MVEQKKKKERSPVSPHGPWKTQNGYQLVRHLAHAVVCELDVTLVVQENVVQLQITVDDALFMKEVQSNTDFSSIKSARKKREIMCLACHLVPQTLVSEAAERGGNNSIYSLFIIWNIFILSDEMT